jgi:hypothetical protein
MNSASAPCAADKGFQIRRLELPARATTGREVFRLGRAGNYASPPCLQIAGTVTAIKEGCQSTVFVVAIVAAVVFGTCTITS